MAQYRRRSGLVPDLGTQIAVTWLESSIAHRRARQQAARGVAPARAAHHGVQASNAILAYFFLIAPVMAFSALAVLASPLGIVLFGPLLAIGTVIGIRLKQWLDTPADRRLVYAIPTWVFVLVGGLWVTGIGVLVLVSMALSV